MKNVKIVLVLITAATLFACGSTNSVNASKEATPPSETELADGYWELVRMTGMPAIKKPMKGDRKIGFSLNASESQINGYAGCNTFFSTYVLNGSNITFSQIGSTKMACVRNPIDEQAFLTMFGQANRIEVKDNLLNLMDSANNVLAVFQHTANDGMVNVDTTDE